MEPDHQLDLATVQFEAHMGTLDNDARTIHGTIASRALFSPEELAKKVEAEMARRV